MTNWHTITQSYYYYIDGNNNWQLIIGAYLPSPEIPSSFRTCTVWPLALVEEQAYLYATHHPPSPSHHLHAARLQTTINRLITAWVQRSPQLLHTQLTSRPKRWRAWPKWRRTWPKRWRESRKHLFTQRGCQLTVDSLQFLMKLKKESSQATINPFGGLGHGWL